MKMFRGVRTYIYHKYFCERSIFFSLSSYLKNVKEKQIGFTLNDNGTACSVFTKTCRQKL